MWQKQAFSLLLPFFVLITGLLIVTGGGQANAATNTNLNFQGRLLTNTGGLVPDGTYNIEFNLYSVSTGGSSEWTETRLNSAGQGVTVRNGYYSVYLGDVNPFPASINWDQELWLGMTVRGTGSCAFGACTPTDAEMTPRFELTAVPYAFRAGAIADAAGNAFTPDDLVQIAPTSFQAVNAAESAIRLNQAGSGGLLELQGDGVTVFSVDKTGAATLGAGITLGDSALTTAGTIRWNGTDFEGYDGTEWVSLTEGSVGVGGTITSSTATFYDSAGGATIGAGSFSTINLDATLSNSDASVIDVASDVVTVTESGFYEISYQVTSRLNSGTRSGFNAKLQLDTGAGFTDVAGSQSYHYGRVVAEVQGTSSANIVLELDAGDSIRLQGQGTTQSFVTVASATSMTVTLLGEGGGGGTTAFQQNGNAFGVKAVLGTTDANGLDIVTDGAVAIAIDATGAATINNGLTISSGSLDLSSGAINQAGDITGAGALTLASGGTSDLTLDSASNVLVLADSTIRRSASGTTTIDLLDGSGSTGLSIVNSDGGQVADLTVEGTVTGLSFVGDGSNLTDLNAAQLTSGVVSDSVLSSNVALLNGTQTFTGSTTFNNNTSFSGGLTVGNSALTAAGNIRFTGTDFEGYDGTQWLSLTSGGGGSGGAGANVIKSVDESISTAVTLQDDDELAFPVGANQTWTFDFVLQAQSGTTPDIQFAVTAPAGSTCLYGYEDSEGSASGAQFGCGVSTGRIEASGAIDTYRVSGTVTTGVTSGNIQLQWSQSTSNAVATIVYAGSYVVANEENGGSGGLGGGGGSGTSFDQGGNSFGAVGLLGTTDAFGLNIITNGSNALTFDAAGLATFTNDLTVSGGLTIDGDITAQNGLTISSGTFADLTLSSASGTIILDASSLQRAGAGTTELDLLDAGGDTTFSIVNTDPTNVANLVVEGGLTVAGVTSSGAISGTTISGNGSALVGLNATNIASGTLDDARLSANVALLDTAQTFSTSQTFTEGVVLGNSVSSSAGAIRWTGADFEGFDGTQWVSLTTSSSAPLLEGVLAFGKYDGVNGVSLNAEGATVAKNGTGDYTVTFDTAATNANYTIQLTVDEPDATRDDVISTADNVSTAGFDVDVHEGDNGGTAGVRVDRTWNYIVFDADAVVGGGGGGPSGLEFVNGGNSFGGTAQLGTTDANGLRLFTDSNIVLDITATGDSTFTGALDTDGLLSVNAGLSLTSGSANLGSNGITNAGSIAGATTIDATGTATVGGLTTAGTATATNVAVDNLTATNAITAPTVGDTINGLVINSGALDSVSGFNQTSGNFTLNGTGTFTTGTGDVTFNGDVTAATTLGVNDGLTVNGTDIGSNSRIFVQDNITVGTGILTGPGVSNTFTFDADNDADESAWTFDAPQGTGLLATGNNGFWVHDTNDTPSADVGPTSGQGGNPDGYIYTEASAPTAGADTFTVTYNTILDASTANWVVEFYWNQRGADNVATLDLQTNEASAGWVTRASFGGGDQPTGATQVWNFESIDLTSAISDPSTEVRFLVTMGTVGNIWNNDFGLDTITIREDTATSSFTYSSNLIEAYNASATSDVDILSLRSDVGETENVVFRVDSDGDVFSDGVNNIAGGADIAENYLNNDDAQPGDVVYFTDSRTVAKTTEENQAGLAGVVSSYAGIILDAEVDGVPVGLKGRVPTNVSIANGTIRRGDYLTSGPNGVAVKAIDSGTAIGIAMEQVEADGMIDVFVGLTYYVAATGDALPAGGLTFIDGTDDASQLDIDGGICSGAGCGYLRLATDSPYLDESLQDTIAINKTGESGSLIALQKDNQAVFTVANTGSLEIRSSSSAALDIRNVGGTSYLTVDTTTGVTTASSLNVTGSLNGAGLTDCQGEYEALQWSADSGLFSCRSLAPKIAQVVDQTGVLGITSDSDQLAIEFDTNTRISEGITYDASTPSRVSVDEAGWYSVVYNIASIGSDESAALRCSLVLNGLDEVVQSRSNGYESINSDLVVNTNTTLIELEANDYIEVICEQESQDATSDTVAGESWLIIEKR